jgi:hypothetical protein
LEGKEARESLERAATFSVPLRGLRFSPSLSAARGRRDSALAPGLRCGGEEWCEGLRGSGRGFYSDGGLR